MMVKFIVACVITLASAVPQLAGAQATLENPAPGSFQSGIGLASGWKCTGGTLTFTIDNGPPAQFVYGSSRLDTQGVCGHSDTGFGALFNWNLVGNGQHTIQVFDNGVQFASATFTVKTLGHQFLSRLPEQQGTVVNFDHQINVTVQWQESCQCFVIVDSTAPIRLGPPTGTNLGPSLPLCEQPDAGRFAAASQIYNFAHQAGFLQRNVSLCAASPDNPRYMLVQGNALSLNINPGLVFYDVTLLNEMKGIDPFGDTFILAHELGHQVQFDNPARAAPPGQPTELQADCLGGIYFGHLIVTDPQFMTTDAQGIAEGICGIAVGRNLSWANIASHGNCEQRAGAFAIGALAELNAEVNHQTFDPFLVCGSS